MEYRRLGKTELMVSAVSFGAIKLPGISMEDAVRIIRQGIDGGMNYIDTARVYGNGDSARKVGAAVKGMRDKVIISSKSLARELNQFKRDVDETISHLQSDYLDILFLHDVSTQQNWDKIQKNGILDYCAKLKQEGRIRHIAFSTHDFSIGKQLAQNDIFEAAMLALNPANPEAEDEMIPLCREKDLGVIIMKPFGGGVLTRERSKQLGFEIEAEDCLRYVVCTSGVDVVIPGLDKAEYVETALQVSRGPMTMTKEERDAIVAKVSIRGKNYCRGCGYCQPCPKNIPIPTVLQLYNRWEIFGNSDWSQMHLIAEDARKSIPKGCGPDQCIACGACQQRCPYSLPIPELMKEAHKAL